MKKGYYYKFANGVTCWFAGRKLKGAERKRYIAENGKILVEKEVTV